MNTDSNRALAGLVARSLCLPTFKGEGRTVNLRVLCSDRRKGALGWAGTETSRHPEISTPRYIPRLTVVSMVSPGDCMGGKVATLNSRVGQENTTPSLKETPRHHGPFILWAQGHQETACPKAARCVTAIGSFN